MGLSAIVYSIAHGSLLFSGAPHEYMSMGINAALVTGFICIIGSFFLKEKSFGITTDTATVSIMASSTLVFDYLTIPYQVAQTTILATFLLLAITSALVFYIVERLNLTNYIRFIPFPVMAGLLTSTGWIIFSSGLSLTNGLTLSVSSLEILIKDPIRPELFIALLIGFSLTIISKKYSTTILMFLALVVSTLAINFFLRSDQCSNQIGVCSESLWLFSSSESTKIIPAWELNYSNIDFYLLFSKIPSIILIAFVMLFSLLLNISSLDIINKKELDYNQILRVHAVTAAFSGLAGGFFGFLSVSRTALIKSTGGGVISSIIVAIIFLFIYLSETKLLTFLPRATMGGIIIYLGASLLKTWFWDQRKLLSKTEMITILLILVTVANFGFMIGFIVGIILASVTYVITSSNNPLTSLKSDISLFSSSVVRHVHQRRVLNEYGKNSIVLKLVGYIFFGSARNIENIFKKIDIRSTKNILIDFSEVLGIDRSAITIFQKILKRESLLGLDFHFVFNQNNINLIKSMSSDTGTGIRVYLYSKLDFAAEAVEEAILRENTPSNVLLSPFDFLNNDSDKKILENHCLLKVFQATEFICNQGDSSNQLFFLKKGSLEIIKMSAGNETRLAKVNVGALVGEMAFYTGDTRSASIKAFSESEVYSLDSDSITKLKKNYPHIASELDVFVIQKLASNLERMNKLVTS